jgi:hypothetical protein
MPSTGGNKEQLKEAQHQQHFNSLTYSNAASCIGESGNGIVFQLPYMERGSY